MFKKMLKSMVLLTCITGLFFTIKSDAFAVTKKAEKIEISKKTVNMKVGGSIFIGFDKESDVIVKVTTSKKSKAFDVSVKNTKFVKLGNEKGKIKITALKSGTADVKIMLKSNHKISKTLKIKISDKKVKYGKVIDITADSYEKEVLNTKGKVIVVFSASWCPHCQHLEPIYEEAAKTKKYYKFTKIDTDLAVNKELIEKEGIDSIPTLYLYENGNIVRFGGSSSAETLEDFINWIEDNE